jgi:hypothetical protein
MCLSVICMITFLEVVGCSIARDATTMDGPASVYSVLLEQDQGNTAIKTDDDTLLQCISPSFKLQRHTSSQGLR